MHGGSQVSRTVFDERGGGSTNTYGDEELVSEEEVLQEEDSAEESVEESENVTSSQIFSGSGANGEIVELSLGKVDLVHSILQDCCDRIESMAGELEAWDQAQYNSIASSKYSYLYPSPRFTVDYISDVYDAFFEARRTFSNTVDYIQSYSNGTSGVMGSDGTNGTGGTTVVVDPLVVGDEKGTEIFNDNGNGTYTDSEGNTYIKVGDNMIKVTDSNSDGVFEDDDGNTYIGVDTDNDGIMDSYNKIDNSSNSGNTDVFEDNSGENGETPFVENGTLQEDIVSSVTPGGGTSFTGDAKSEIMISEEGSSSHLDSLLGLYSSGTGFAVSDVVGNPMFSDSGSSLNVNKSKLISHLSSLDMDNVKSAGITGTGGVVTPGVAIVGGSAVLGGAAYGGTKYYQNYKQKHNDEDDKSNEKEKIEEEENTYKVEEERIGDTGSNILEIKKQIIASGEVDY